MLRLRVQDQKDVSNPQQILEAFRLRPISNTEVYLLKVSAPANLRDNGKAPTKFPMAGMIGSRLTSETDFTHPTKVLIKEQSVLGGTVKNMETKSVTNWVNKKQWDYGAVSNGLLGEVVGSAGFGVETIMHARPVINKAEFSFTVSEAASSSERKIAEFVASRSSACKNRK